MGTFLSNYRSRSGLLGKFGRDTSYRLPTIIRWNYISLANSSGRINWVNGHLIPATENPDSQELRPLSDPVSWKMNREAAP